MSQPDSTGTKGAAMPAPQYELPLTVLEEMLRDAENARRNATDKVDVAERRLRHAEKKVDSGAQHYIRCATGVTAWVQLEKRHAKEVERLQAEIQRRRAEEETSTSDP